MIAGKMIAQSVGLSTAEISYVSDYLSEAAEGSDDWLTAMRCPAMPCRALRRDMPSYWRYP